MPRTLRSIIEEMTEMVGALDERSVEATKHKDKRRRMELDYRAAQKDKHAWDNVDKNDLWNHPLRRRDELQHRAVFGGARALERMRLQHQRAKEDEKKWAKRDTDKYPNKRLRRIVKADNKQ